MDHLRPHLVQESVEDYRDGRLNRREFLRRLALVTASSILALSLAEALGCGPGAPPTAAAPPVSPTPIAAPTATPTPEPAGIVRPDDSSLEAGPVEFRTDGTTLLGYLARPRGLGPHPALLVIHENRGLLPHFPDVARRLAKAGYVSLALDLVSREGGIGKFTDPAEAAAILRRAPTERLVEDLNSGVRYLQSLPYVRRERVGAIGFCFGGGMVGFLRCGTRSSKRRSLSMAPDRLWRRRPTFEPLF